MQRSDHLSPHRPPGRIPDEDAVRQALDAVCAELGIDCDEHDLRDAIAQSIEAAWSHGRTQPLYLVDAGLGAAGA